MEYKDLIELIRTFFLQKNISINQLYLFGSRAREDNNIDSDFDFCIVFDDSDIEIEKRKLTRDLRNYIYKNHLNISIDMVLKSLKSWNWESENIGFLSYTIKNEGKLLWKNY